MVAFCPVAVSSMHLKANGPRKDVFESGGMTLNMEGEAEDMSQAMVRDDGRDRPLERSGVAGVATVRVGVDVATVADVQASLSRFGDRYLARVFTQHERESCTGPPPVRASSLAARFAAKEATMKVLRVAEEAVTWRDIEVQSGPSGACELRLSGEAARLADTVGAQSWSVSLTHEGGLALAIVAACGDFRR